MVSGAERRRREHVWKGKSQSRNPFPEKITGWGLIIMRKKKTTIGGRVRN